MPDMVRLAGQVGAQSVSFIPVSIYDGINFLRLSSSQAQEIQQQYLPESKRCAESLGISTNTDIYAFSCDDIHKKIPCYIGWFFSIILADGTVNPCCQCLRSVGSLKTQHFKDIWNSTEYCQLRRQMSNIPKTRGEIKGCRCNNCGFALNNLSMHRFLHPISSRSLRTSYSLKDLKRFIFG